MSESLDVESPFPSPSADPLADPLADPALDPAGEAVSRTIRFAGLELLSPQWSSIHLLDKKAGYSECVFAIQDSSELRFRVLTSMPYMAMEQTQVAVLNADLSIRTLSASLTLGTELTYAGEVRDGVLAGEVRSGGAVFQRETPVPEGVYLPELLPCAALVRGLEAGDETAFPAFRIDNQSVESARVVILSRRPGEVRMAVDFAGQTSETRWTETGRFLGESGIVSGIPVRSEPTTRAEAMRMPETAESRLTQNEIIDQVRIPASRPIADPRRVRQLVARISPLPATGVHVDPPVQTLRGGEDEAGRDNNTQTLTITAVPLAELRVLEPEPGFLAQAAVAPWTRPSLLIDSEHPALRARAGEVTAGADGPLEKARAIRRYCHDHIDRSALRFTLPSALEVLETLAGDCNEHAALFAGLARAAGLPCKPVSGVTYIRYGDDRDGFYYHSWNEVGFQTPDGLLWVPFDATLATDEVDATHIKLVEGDLDQQADINQLIGRLQIEILDVRTDLR